MVVLSNKYSRFGIDATDSFVSYGAAAVVDVGLFGVSPDKTCQNKPVPFWQVNRELFHRSLRYGWDVRTLKRGTHD